ncbi:hypothetical protein MAH1_37060 [Sessilibacter sp. MAH1]
MGRSSEHRVLSQAQKHAVIQRNYRYPQAGNLESIDDLNKGSTQYFYDALERLKQVEGFVNEQFDFDPANNLIQQSEQPKAEQAQQNPNRAKENSNQTTESAQEFANSNIVSLDKAREQKAEKQTKGNRLAFQGDRHFTYDSRGNLIKEARGKNGKLVTEFRYNAQNQLVEVNSNGTKTHYQYDALGRRTKKISADTETQFLWNGDVLLSETQYGKNAEQKELLNAKIYVFEPNSFKPLAQIQNDEIYHYHLDHLGTPQELTANDGSIVWSAQYKTYGNLALKTVETIENNLRFQGQYFDQETGLHYNRHRYYNPNTGQFTQQDPIGLLGGINNYQYVPNPITWVDPFGLSCKEGKNRQLPLTPESAPKRVDFSNLNPAFMELWKKSFPKGISQEHGGTLVSIKGKIQLINKGAGDRGSFSSDLNVPDDTQAVGIFHTHPYDETEGGHTGISLSGGDAAYLINQNL